MFILNTNVISEAMKPSPDPAVLTWLNKQPSHGLYITAISVAELKFGVASLPAGRRKNSLHEALEGMIELFAKRILPFDTDSARKYAGLAVTTRKNGLGLPTPDGYIAAIAAAKAYIVATRDTSPFEAGNIQVINPWHAS